ncbi:PREDICTED: proton-associated sugar transporter A-like [Amphimedon queenslandica]|uniref:Major facilitator superfamily (MFS) profile domain-containing protein n=1 Tax=Amphimedon queenslandica TaxID=400682 RepID=A0A1X7VNG0_AMPQE|nr:PREDICTED: proton-associated sugar transporter A-like [Amphimedon queenslandica]|eukprot:XP_019861744.1 PREDICTED: proton-associated sugar transporter A-like [Amphimedon queenslandica]
MTEADDEIELVSLSSQNLPVKEDKEEKTDEEENVDAPLLPLTVQSSPPNPLPESDNENEDSTLESPPPPPGGKVPLWRIILLSASGGAIDLVFAIEDTYAVPLIVATGLDIRYATIMLALSPLIGTLFQAYLGSLSDGCKCSWGKRRPFILFLSLLACLGLVIAPLFPSLFSSYTAIGTLGAVTGVAFFDFGMGQLQLPSRAYLLDTLGPTSQVQTGNFIYIIIIGIGTCTGYILSGIDWNSLFNKDNAKDTSTVIVQAQFIFGIAAVMVLICLIATLCSVKEKNPDSSSCIKACPCTQSPKNIVQDFLKATFESFKFVWHMSKHMWLLLAVMLFGFLSLYTFLFFFTSFVGGAVFGGVPSAPKDSEAYQLYAEGVRKGSWALAAGAGFLALSSLFMDRIAKVIGLRVMFLTVQYAVVIVYFVLTFFPLLALSYIGACIALLCQGLYLSIPFTLISLYEANGLMFRKSYSSGNIGGRACFILNTGLFLGEALAGFTTGPLINLFQSSSAIVMSACVSAGLGAVLSAFLYFP